MSLHLNNTSTAVSLEDFDRAELGAKLGIQFGPETAMLVNNTDRTIVAARIIWTSPNPLRPEKPYKTVLQTDIFQAPWMKPILAHSRTVVGPGVLVSESIVSESTGKGFICAARTPQQEARYSSGDTTVTLDAVMFDDGEVVGPDTRHLADDMTARKTAVAMLLAKVRKEGGTRQSLESVIAGAQFTPTSAQEVRVANALRDLANLGMTLLPEIGHFPSGRRLASVEQWLLALPQPPTPFKTGPADPAA